MRLMVLQPSPIPRHVQVSGWTVQCLRLNSPGKVLPPYEECDAGGEKAYSKSHTGVTKLMMNTPGLPGVVIDAPQLHYAE